MKLPASQQHPLAAASTLQTLQDWREHENSPQWNWECGDRLGTEQLQLVREYAAQLSQNPNNSRINCVSPAALHFAEFCAQAVPIYRERLGDFGEITRENWAQIPFCTRTDLAREVWHFVPDERDLGDMIVYWTSGTTGSEVHLPAPLEWASLYLPWFETALQKCGVLWKAEPVRIAWATVAAQEHTLTYLSPSSYLDSALTMKVNLHPSQWRHAADAMLFLNEANPQVLAGDPISLQVLADSDFCGAPLAVLSSALQLDGALRETLQNRFGCPVLDIYSSNETGPIAFCADGETWQIPDSSLYLEIVREDGAHCAENEVGEIIVTSQRNSLLPLLRYRTGDFARYERHESGDVLRDFHGRAPVLFQTVGDEIVNSIDVTHALRHLLFSEFSLHQNADLSLQFRFRGGADETAIRAVLETIFPNIPLQTEELTTWPHDNRKLIRYSRDS